MKRLDRSETPLIVATWLLEVQKYVVWPLDAMARKRSRLQLDGRPPVLVLYSERRGLICNAALQHNNGRRFESGTNANQLQIRFCYDFERNFVAIRFLYERKR